MRARTSVAVAGGRLAQLRCEPPLAVRPVHAEPGVIGLCLVGTAAGPLPGDDLALHLSVEGATVDLTAAAASIAQGRGGAPARLHLGATLGAGARLYADPGALVVSAGAAVGVEVAIDLAADAHVEWHELVVLGRSGEPGGSVTLRWDVTRAGRPLLRQHVDLADPSLRSWTGMTGGHRVLASSLISGPAVAARTVVHSPTAVAQQLADDGVLISVLADDAATAVERRDRLIQRLPAFGPHDASTAASTTITIE